MAKSNISIDSFPAQEDVGKRVNVSFEYSNWIAQGEIVRNDVEEPFQTIIRLADGRFVLGSECQYQWVEWGE